MTCRECQERLFASRRTKGSSNVCREHLFRCCACREFAEVVIGAAGALDRWEERPDPRSATSRAALVARLSAAPEPAITPLDRPLLPSLLGATGAAIGLAIAPDWARGLLLAWLGGAGLVALMVLLQSPWRGMPRGEIDRWTPITSD